jgi:hypothetical protein
MHVVIFTITDLHLEETVSDLYTEGFCTRCGQKRRECWLGFGATGVRCVERRAHARGTGTFKKVLDVTYTQIRKTEAENEQNKKGD